MPKKGLMFAAFVGFILLAVLAGCSGSSAPPSGPTLPPSPPIVVPTTPPAPAATITVPSKNAPASPTPAATAIAANTAAPAAQATSATPRAARIAIQTQGYAIQLVDRSGKTSPYGKLSGPVDFFSIYPYDTTLGNRLYLPVSGPPPSDVVRVDSTGVQKLDWIKGPINGLAVSAKGLAWGMWDQNSNPTTVSISTSSLNGSGSKVVISKKQTGIPVVWSPLRWAKDGKLFFSQDPTGLGGYILFGGRSNIWLLDPATGKTSQVLGMPETSPAICIDDLSPDEQMAADHCAITAMRIDFLSGNKTPVTIKPPAKMPPFAAVGGARFSPDNSRLAYALARRNPDDEQGWVAITDGLTGTSKLIATSPAKDYFAVVGWLDANTIVLQSSGEKAGVWIVDADGSNLKRLADGIFVGIVRP